MDRTPDGQRTDCAQITNYRFEFQLRLNLRQRFAALFEAMPGHDPQSAAAHSLQGLTGASLNRRSLKLPSACSSAIQIPVLAKCVFHASLFLRRT